MAVGHQRALFRDASAAAAATQHYAKITPTKLAKSYADAGYFSRNLRAIEVLVDQEVVRSGRALTDLGSSTISGTATAHTTSSSGLNIGI